MKRALKVLLHGLGVLASAAAGYLLAIAIIAFIPLDGPFGKTWIFLIELALILVLPILGVFLYVLLATPRGARGR
jgi:hypothetical protein